MADLREVIYGGNTFTIPSGGEVPSLQQIYDTHSDLTVNGSADLYIYDGDGASGSFGVSGARIDSGTDLYTDIDAGSVTVGWNNLPCITLSGNYDASVTPAVAGGSVSMSPKMRESFRQVLGIDTLEAELAAKEARIAALEALLADHADVRLTLTDANGGSTAYDVLGKEYVAPPTTMFDFPAGIYGADGTLLVNESDMESLLSMSWERPSEDEWELDTVDLANLPAGAAGIILPSTNGGDAVLGFSSSSSSIIGTSGQLDWLVIPENYGYIPPAISATADLITDTIYYKGTGTGAPWGQTNATINTVGTPVPWTE